MAGERVHLVTGPHEDLREHINIVEYIEGARSASCSRRVARMWRRYTPAGLPRQASTLEQFLRDIMLDQLGRDPAPDVLEALAIRIRGLEGATDTKVLFDGLPGRAPRPEQMKRVTHALLQGVSCAGTWTGAASSEASSQARHVQVRAGRAHAGQAVHNA